MKTWDSIPKTQVHKTARRTKRPPFKWAGGKDRMFVKYATSGFFPKDDVGIFVDVFAGSGCASRWIRETYPDAVIVLNDQCAELMNMFRYMQSPTYAMFEKEYISHVNAYANFTNVESRKKYYYELRNRYALASNSMNPIEQAAALLFMLQTGFNGIWQTSKNFNYRYASPAGLMTWKPNGSVFSIPAVRNFSQFLDTCVIMAQDFEKTQAYFGKDSWFYADPPYRKSFARYKSAGEFTDVDQVRLINFLHDAHNSGAKCALSNRESLTADEIPDYDTTIAEGWFADKFNDDWNCKYFNTKYTAGRHNKGPGAKAVEVLIRNYAQ